MITIIPKMILDLRTEQFKGNNPYGGVYIRKYPQTSTYQAWNL